MKIAIVVTKFPALSETFILSEIVELIRNGHDVTILTERADFDAVVHPDVEEWNLRQRTTVLCGHGPKRLKHLLCLLKKLAITPGGWKLVVQPKLWRSENMALAFTRVCSALSLIGKGQSFDVIHCHFGINGRNVARYQAMGLLQGKIAASFLGFDLSKVSVEQARPLYKELFDIGCLFMAVSRNFKERLQSVGCPDGKLTVHYLGVQLEKFRFAERKEDARNKLRLISVCRLVEKKGLQYALQAARLLALQGIDFDYEIIGTGPLDARLRNLVAEYGLGDRVSLLGEMPRDLVIEHLNGANILLAPSMTAADGNQEGIPAIIAEAMALGLPVVSTWHSGIPEVIENGVTGFLVPEKDGEALARCLATCRDNPEQLREIALNARRFVEAHRDLNLQHARLEDMFAQLNLQGVVSAESLNREV